MQATVYAKVDTLVDSRGAMGIRLGPLGLPANLNADNLTRKNLEYVYVIRLFVNSLSMPGVEKWVASDDGDEAADVL
jgi:hypothetical protein